MKSLAVSFSDRKYYGRKAFLDGALAQQAWSALDNLHRMQTRAPRREGTEL
jgi:hypothetical protein